MVATTPGRRLGRYHLVEPLGGGPNGEVYRAKVVGVAGMERQLAVKRFYPQVTAQPGVAAKLSQASRTYGSLDHPRIARLAELGVAGGDTFTATELVVGLDLARLIAMALETGQAILAGSGLGLVSAAARAIGYAHGRGVSHLGLAPTNIVATPDGDVKVTDVGILACRLPPRPSTDASLALRLPYLAPEQLIGDPVSAATDVFALGVIAYELVTGMRPFGGATPHEIEQAVLSGRPAPLELPRPVARVLDRCLARSPFERFPDARAFADALDAALRLAPLAGGKGEVGEQVKAALEHMARMNEQQLSGALSFAVPTPPPSQRPSAPPSLPLQPPTPTLRGVGGGGPTHARPWTSPSVSPPQPPRGTTLRHNAPPMPRPGTENTTGARTTVRDPDAVRGEPAPAELDESHLAVGDQTEPRGRIEPLWPPTEPVQTLRALGELPPEPPRASGSPPPVPPPVRPSGSQPPPLAGGPPPAPTSDGPPMFSHYGPGTEAFRLRGSRTPVVAALVVGAAVLGAGGFYLHRFLTREPAATGPARAASDAALEPAAPDAAAPSASGAGPDAGRARTPADAAPAASAVDAGATLDAAAAPPPDDPRPTAPAPTDKLLVSSTPPGARVFLDGTEQGKTPATVAGSSDRLNLAVFLPGHALYLASVEGAGAHQATLTPVKEWVGPGGIKVRCHTGGRYYVFIDGEPTGQLCPTERIPVSKGEHQVEIYDLVTEARKQFKVVVKQVARSTRVKVD